MRRSARCLVASVAALVPLAALTTASNARASNVTEVPDIGSEQMARGGAWVARASDPLAVSFNPAGLAGQPTRITIQENISFRSTCFRRVKAASDTTVDGVAPGAAYAEACNDVAPFLNPQIAMTLRVTDRLGLGLALLGPNAVGRMTFPDFAGASPSPQRYLLLDTNSQVLNPTIGAGLEIVPGLRVGASFVWGIAHVKASRATVALTDPGMDPAVNDYRASIDVLDGFVPGANLGALWSPSPLLDVGAWWKWSAPISASGSAQTSSNWFTGRVAGGDTSKVVYGDTRVPDCGQPGSTACGHDVTSFEMAIPMEAKLGARVHVPRARTLEAGSAARPRDPIADDLFDVELDLTYANNAAIDDVHVRFPSGQDGQGIVPVAGSAGRIPPNADVRHAYKDVVGARLGGDFVVVPDVLSLRSGVFVESRGQDARYQNIDFMGGERLGFSVGATVRIRGRAQQSKGAFEVMVGYMHVVVGTQSNDDPRAPGLGAMAGTAPYATPFPVNLGRVTSAVDAANFGIGYRF
jgi:long-chain fatty acid transport protein